MNAAASRTARGHWWSRPLPPGLAGIVRDARQQAGLTQTQLAAKAKVTLRTVQRLEAGKTTTLRTLSLVARVLGIVVDITAAVVVLAAWGWAFGSALAGTP